MSAFEICGRDVSTGLPIAVTVEGGKIARISELAESCETWLSAGMIDLQVNGFGGFDMNADGLNPATVTAFTERMFAHGVTCFLPTVITANEEKICHILSVIAETRRRDVRVAAAVPYVHVEGPHISPLDGYKGAHDARWVRPPSVAELERWQHACNGLVGMVTLSPHYVETVEYIAHLAKCGVHVALGHTHASTAKIRAAVDAGARLSTHLGNGLAGEIPRHRNSLWAQLTDDRLTASVIADGHHLPPELIEVIRRSKGRDRVVLVSDAVSLAGMPAGHYEAPVGGRVELRADGRLCVEGTELLAGSLATLGDCVRGWMQVTGQSLGEAMTLATALPGRFVGGRGVLAEGEPADLVQFEWDDGMHVRAVWLRGEKVHEQEA